MIDVHELQEISLLVLSRRQIVNGTFSIKSKAHQVGILNVFGIATARRQVTPGNVRQQKMSEVKSRAWRSIEALQKVLKLEFALIVPGILKDTSF